MKTYVIGDIHGGLKALQQLIQKVTLRPTDQLIFLGDYVDGWSDAAATIDYLINLAKQYTCIFIKGNHDIWCQEWLEGTANNELWLAHGGSATVTSYAALSDKERTAHLAFFRSMLPYYIDSEQRLFIHAGFTSMHGVHKETFTKNFHFDRTLWETALAAHQIHEIDDYYPERLRHYKEIYIGHTPTTRYKQSTPMRATNVWNIDTGAAFKGRLSMLDIENKSFWQSDPVYQLYPTETGRNKSPYKLIKTKKS